MRLLMKQKKEMKEQMRHRNNDEDMDRLQKLKEQILQEESENYYRRLKKTCEEISQHGKLNSGGFRKFKKRKEWRGRRMKQHML